jgi:hypothetical protein
MPSETDNKLTHLYKTLAQVPLDCLRPRRKNDESDLPCSGPVSNRVVNAGVEESVPGHILEASIDLRPLTILLRPRELQLLAPLQARTTNSSLFYIEPLSS